MSAFEASLRGIAAKDGECDEARQMELFTHALSKYNGNFFKQMEKCFGVDENMHSATCAHISALEEEMRVGVILVADTEHPVFGLNPETRMYRSATNVTKLIWEVIAGFKKKYPDRELWNRKACTPYDRVLAKRAKQADEEHAGGEKLGEVTEKTDMMKENIIALMRKAQNRSVLLNEVLATSEDLKEESSQFDDKAGQVKDMEYAAMWKSRMQKLCVCLYCVALTGGVLVAVMPSDD